MDSKSRKENFIRYLFPFQFRHNRGTVVSFLSDIFVNFQKRSNNNFDTYTFQELIGIPMIISDKLYYTFTMHQEKQLTYQEFSSGLYDLFFGDLDDKMSIVFDLLDFDGDGVILADDVFLILSHFHLIENTTESIHLIEKLISNFFGTNKYKLDKDNCFNIKKNFDVLLLVIIFLNKYITVISDLELCQYEQIARRKKDDKGGFAGYNICTVDDYEEMEYKPTINLFNYLELTEFGCKKKKVYDYEDSDSDEDLENDDEDLDALYDFSIDFQKLRDRFINQCSYEPRLLTSTFSCSFFQEEREKLKEQKKEKSVELLNEILMNQSYKKMKFKEKRKNDIKDKDKTKSIVILSKDKDKNDKNDDNISLGNITSTNVDSVTNYASLRRATTNYYGIRKTTSKMRNKIEVVLYKKKDEKNSINKEVKFLLCGHYIFYYKNNRGNFLYKKIIPISSLFISKNKKENCVEIALFSYLHNLEIKKEFYTNKINDANKFYSKFNRTKMFRDMKKEYYFKVKVGEGKFGQVILAERYSDKKLLAIKAVQKGYQSIEEYKINRWEIDIFKMLQNVIHPNIIKCIDFYEYECQIFFVYEFIASGDLRKISKELKLYPQYYTIDTVLKLSMQMIEGVKILHKYGVIHRDIKTTNMVIDIRPSSSEENNHNDNHSDFETDFANISNSVLKIIDFGLSRILGKYEYSNDPYGSLCFKAPELIEHLPYDFKVDIWAIGVTIYYLVYRELPFEKGSKEEIKYNIVHECITFRKNIFMNNFNYYDGSDPLDIKNTYEFKSSILFSIIKDCLEKNPDKRINIEQLSQKYTPIISALT